MQKELVAQNVYVFTSALYAQVTAGAIYTPEGIIAIDTMPFPVESREIVRFLHDQHDVPIRYVINTHYHADHTYGTCFFPRATVIAQDQCRDLLDVRGRVALENSKLTARDLNDVEICLPDLTFEQQMAITVGEVTLDLRHAPGHSPDSTTCLMEEAGILFAADSVMPVPFFSDGCWHDLMDTLSQIRMQQYETIVQGHGEVILRGEIPERIDEDMAYLEHIYKLVKAVVDRNGSEEDALHVSIEQCGKSRIALNGIGHALHLSNARALYHHLREDR